jgi:hypothetical protein
MRIPIVIKILLLIIFDYPNDAFILFKLRIAAYNKIFMCIFIHQEH